MAINYLLGQLIARTIRDQRITGTLLQLGRQGVYISDRQLGHILQTYDFGRFDGPQPELLNAEFVDRCIEQAVYHRNIGGVQTLNDAVFFCLLGLVSYSSDANNYEDCDLILDLNTSELSQSLAATQYDVVLDGGTIEHVFHLPNALANVHRLTKSGGHVIHVGVANGNVDHGFYQISPCFFLEYYDANHYSIVESKLFTNTDDINSPRFVCEDYTSMAGIPQDRQYLYYIVVRKNDASTCGVVPFQRFYSHGAWGAQISMALPPITRYKVTRLAALAGPGGAAIWCATALASAMLTEVPGLKEAVRYVVDRNPAKQGGEVEGVPIVSPERLLGELAGIRSIIIASQAPLPVYNELASNERLRPLLVMLG